MIFLLLLLIVFSLLLFILPFVPAFLELFHPSYNEPLPLHLGIRETGYFARVFAQNIQSFFKNDLLSDSDVRKGKLPNGAQFLFVGKSADSPFSTDELWSGEVTPMLVSLGTLSIPPRFHFHSEVYGNTAVEASGSCSYVAVYSRGHMRLGPLSRLARWAHAEGALEVGRLGLLRGRVSSDSKVTLRAGCRFQRLQAPTIDFDPTEKGLESLSQLEKKVADGFTVLNSIPERQLVQGDVEILPEEVLVGDIVATGTIVVGERARVMGSLKSHKNIVVGRGALVKGSVIAIGDIRVLSQAWLEGPIIAERKMVVQSGVIIGSTEAPTTLTCDLLRVDRNVRLHGTIWAYRSGRVRA